MEGVFIMTQTKLCSICKEEKTVSFEFFFKSKGGKDGFRTECKSCHMEKYKESRKISQKKSYHKNIDHIIKYKEGNKERARLYHKDYQKSYQEKKAKQISERRRIHRLNNLESLNKYQREWGQLESSKKLNVKNEQKRNAAKKALESTLTLAEWEVIKENFNNNCAYCGGTKKLEQDHFIPSSKGGEYTHNNIIPSCRSCNSSKGNRDFFTWYLKNKHYNKRRESKILKYLGYDKKIQQLSIL